MQGMKMGLLAALSLGSVTAASNAAVVLSDTFDTYADQAAFEAAWPSIATTSEAAKKSTQLSSARSVSAPSSVLVPVSTTATTSLTEYRNRRAFSETSTLSSAGNLGVGDQLVWSFSFYDSQTGLTDRVGNPQRNSSNLQDTTGPSGTNQLVSLGLNNNLLAHQDGGNYYMARILGYTPIFQPAIPGAGTANPATASGAYFKLNAAGAPLRSTGWHTLKVVMSTDDGVATDYQFFVDNTLSKTISNVGAAGTLRSYDNITLGSGLTNGVTANFDNVLLEVIPAPEPASLALLGLVGAGLLSRRRT